MYPSVSICKKLAFDFETVKFEIKSIDEIIVMVLNKSWSIDDQFYFFTHPKVMNLTFPYTTTLGGVSPGRPCVFPFTTVFGKTFYTCQAEALETTQPACLTKVGEDKMSMRILRKTGDTALRIAKEKITVLQVLGI